MFILLLWYCISHNNHIFAGAFLKVFSYHKEHKESAKNTSFSYCISNLCEPCE